MTPETYQQAGRLFDQLRALPLYAQRSALETACAGDEELRDQVLRLLQADRDSAGSSFLARDAMSDVAHLLAPDLVPTPEPFPFNKLWLL